MIPKRRIGGPLRGGKPRASGDDPQRLDEVTTTLM